jgi:hypothetical protein
MEQRVLPELKGTDDVISIDPFLTPLHPHAGGVIRTFMQA